MKTNTIVIAGGSVIMIAVLLFFLSKKEKEETQKVQAILPEDAKKTIASNRKTKLPYIKQDSDLALWLYENLSDNDLKSIGGMMIFMYKDAHSNQKYYSENDAMFDDEVEFVRNAAWQAFASPKHPADMEFDGGYSDFAYCLDTEV